MVVRSVTGTGRTTVGVPLAARLGVSYAEGDDFRPRAGVAKVLAGVPLADRGRPRPAAIGAWARGRGSAE